MNNADHTALPPLPPPQQLPPLPTELQPPPPGLPPFGEFPPVVSDPIPEEDPAVVRRRRFWNKFGVEGFATAVGLLVVFLLVAMLLVFRTFIYTKTPDDFTTGAGGGNSGEKVTMNTHRVKPKNARSMVKSLPKLVAKGASSVSLPDIPNVSLNALESGNPLGAASKGLGGGAGGGEGGGIGPGKGGGRNLVSLFGRSDFRTAGLIGTFYDFKQGPRGQQRGFNTGRFMNETRVFFQKNWDVSYLERTAFRAPQRLVISQFCIPNMSAAAAPKAFDSTAAPSNWLVHYKGVVTAPFTGKIRFVGGADDFMAVRWNKQNVLDFYGPYNPNRHVVPSSKQGNPYGPGKRHPDTLQTYPAVSPGWLLVCGPWLDVRAGSKYPIEVVFGEGPGSLFYSILCFEKKDDRGKFHLFRMSAGEQPNDIKGKWLTDIDLTGGKYVWKPERDRSVSRR
ncbi:MAG: hypothetical protein LBS59_06190 [Puniceicoccales bacterium]|jgi:hypothetical protein|nr:hypothetical protein [Puniceicoccales bacterium]